MTFLTKIVDLIWKLIIKGIRCHQVKEKRNKGYSGKSDKKQNAVEGKVVGYDDLQGSLRVKVYYPATATFE